MRLLISGICGFVGNTLARALAEPGPGHRLVGFDNFSRPGSETNRGDLRRLGVELHHVDLRAASDVDALPACDWVIDAAANSSVLAGVDGQASSRQLVEHNLGGTVNLLEYCKRHRAGFTLLSTSRVYSIAALAALEVEVVDHAFRPRLRRGRPQPVEGPHLRPNPLGHSASAPHTAADPSQETVQDGSGVILPGLSSLGISENFPTQAPVSLYGATKLASEALALEYGSAFDLPVFVNRCGVLAGAGQFGRPDQGIFTYWLNSYLRRRPLRYLGFDGQGHQVRDCLHPRDLAPLLAAQFAAARVDAADRVVNLGGGLESATSLRRLSDWCARRFGTHEVGSDPARRAFDLPWVVLDSNKAARRWGWRPQTSVPAILEEIAAHAETHPDWLDVSAPL